MARPITYDPSAVLDRAIDLFWNRGYQAVSIDDLVRTTGLNRHSLYGRYGNKYGLLRAALKRYIDTCLGAVREVLSGPGNALARIEALLAFRDPDCSNSLYRRMLEQGCLAFRVGAELRESHPELEQLVQEKILTQEQFLADIIREGQQQGCITRRNPPDELASIVMDGYLAPLMRPSHPRRKRAILSVLS
jgi:TetR/AcrR family transcriptional repressor of nem operon